MDVLLLNSSYQAIKIISWQRAITLWYLEKAEIVEESDEELRSPSFSMKCPSVVRLKRYVKPAMGRGLVRLSRHNIYARDNFSCLYCGVQPGIKKLTLDHVIPKSKGGDFSWKNIATACLDCNFAKADMMLDEARMKLLSIPDVPISWRRTNHLRSNKNVPESWKQYII